MTANEIEESVASHGWDIHESKGTTCNSPADMAQFLATMQVAYQLALLNERLDDVFHSRFPQFRVMVEPGDYPIQVRVQKETPRGGY